MSHVTMCQGGAARAFFLIFFLTVLTCFDVFAGYMYSQGSVGSGTRTGIIAVALQMSLLAYPEASVQS